MPRDIPIGNGSLLITFDKDYCIRDIYFPNIGMENHTEGHPFRFGVWADGCFSWMGNEWEKQFGGSRRSKEKDDSSQATKDSGQRQEARG